MSETVPQDQKKEEFNICREREFIYACQQGDYGIINKFLQTVNINCFNGKALRVIIENNCGPNSLNIFLKLLHSPNMDPNLSDITGTTALHSAMRYNHYSALTHLLFHPQLDVNIKNADGDTPAMVGINYCSLESLELLLSDPRVKLDDYLESFIGRVVIAGAVEQRWDGVWVAHEKMKQLIQNAKKEKQKRVITDFLKEVREESDFNGNKHYGADNGVKFKIKSKKVCDENIQDNRNHQKDHFKDEKNNVKFEKGNNIRCFVCDDILKIGELKVHLECKHPNASFDCANCPVKFKTMDIHKISGHMKSVHNLIHSFADNVEYLIKEELIWLPNNLTYVKCQLCEPNKVLVARDATLLKSHIKITHKKVSVEDLQSVCDSDKYFKFFCRICGYYKGSYTKTMTSLNDLMGHINEEHNYGQNLQQRKSSMDKDKSEIHVNGGQRGPIKTKSRLRELNYNEPNRRSEGEPRVLKRKTTNSLFNGSKGVDWGTFRNKRPRTENDTRLGKIQDSRKDRYGRTQKWSQDSKSQRDHDARTSGRECDARSRHYDQHKRESDSRVKGDHDKTPQRQREKVSMRQGDNDVKISHRERCSRPQRERDSRPRGDYDAKTAHRERGSRPQEDHYDKTAHKERDARLRGSHDFRTPHREERDYDYRTPHKMDTRPKRCLPEGQRLYIAINKTIDEVSWNGEDIIVMKNVKITPPYKPENVRGNMDSKALIHVRKIVEMHLKDREVPTKLISNTTLQSKTADTKPLNVDTAMRKSH